MSIEPKLAMTDQEIVDVCAREVRNHKTKSDKQEVIVKAIARLSLPAILLHFVVKRR